ncbi:helix-turn-helix domain-containing protein [Aquimarina sp. U1-2]|nr:helix-turn-helix domain-containing protein [Aquimarina sp. U1-2]
MLKKKALKNKDLASAIDEHAQTISAILNQKRGINPNLSIKLGKRFGVSDDYFMLLQASYDVRKARLKQQRYKNYSALHIRKNIFWDTDFDTIDWDKNKRAVIKRVFERGNDHDIGKIISFYGKEVVSKELKNIKNDFLPSFDHNIKKYSLFLDK